MAATRDPSTLSNYGAWRTKHITTDFTVDFDGKKLKGSVILKLESQTDKASKEVILDTRFNHISSIKVGAQPMKWHLGEYKAPLGTPLHIEITDGASKGDVIDVEMEVETTEKCTALQWLTPEQTSSKKYPYLFSQCEAINCRSIFPCQDTPDVKAPITFNITSSLPVLTSGIPIEDHAISNTETLRLYKFEQDVPIPAYLFSIASGEIEKAYISESSFVASGPNELAACKWELEEDMGKFVETAESLIFANPFKFFSCLVLPPSFCFGGMEHPTNFFATPTIISGDRQNVDVMAHELSHNWAGNLVTNSSWEHFWLNEGWTVYLERRILGKMHGDAEFHFSAIIGWKGLEDAIELFGKDHEYTKLIIDHDGADPEDVYSQVAYEKGFHFVWYLERLVGRENFDKFMPHYFKTWSGKSLDSWEFKNTFLGFFNEFGDDIKQKISTIDWDGRYYTPGLPPKPEFDTTMVDACYKLAEQWKYNSYEPSLEDVKSLTGNQKLVFLQRLQQFEPLTPERAQLLGKTYEFSTSQNAEVKTAYLLVAMKAGDPTCVYGVVDLVGRVGRMKFVRPLFRALNKSDRALALDTFAKNRDFYHPICRGMVEKDLGI